VSDDIQQVPSAELGEDAGEGWERLVDDADIRGISAYRIILGEQPYWSVEVSLAEFLREEPLESELRQQMAAALEAVPDVEVVAAEDRESWFVTGNPSGEALVRAAAQVVDQLADRARAHLDSLGSL
jgi:PAS domain-containing protein